MGTREGQYWRTVRPGFSGWDPQRIETDAKDGVPDVNHKFGDVELKYVREWPKRPETPLRVEHYSQHQRVWHTRRCKAGGRCHVLLGVGKDHLLIWGEIAAKYLGHVSKMELIMRSDAHWTDAKTLRRELRHEILARSQPWGMAHDQETATRSRSTGDGGEDGDQPSPVSDQRSEGGREAEAPNR